MRIISLLIVTMLNLVISGLTFGADKLNANEKIIEFKANSGETTDAVEGHFFVPENRLNPGSRQIRINYIRFPAKGNAGGSPIVYLSGGPGGSGIGTAKWRRFPLFEALREFGDVIALDQRGTGSSEQADECVSSQTMIHSQVFSASQIEQRYRTAAIECFNNWKHQGVDVYGYTTVQNALDIDDLREHLGAKKISLWGISYGSHLALSAMKLYPKKIEKVIIASAEGVDQTVKLPAKTDQYFRQVQKIIDQQSLSKTVQDLPALMKRVHDKLEENPISIKTESRDGQEIAVLLQSTHMKMFSSMLIADPNQYLAMLIQAYVELDRGHIETVSRLLSRGMFKDEPIRFRLMSLAMDVASGISNGRLDKVTHQAKTSLLGDNLNFPMPLLNNVDPELDLGESFRVKPQSDIPTLLLTGSLDGRTYPDEQRAAVSGLSNLTHVTVKYAGHNLFTSSPEVLARMSAFLSGSEMPTSDIELPLPNLSVK